MLTEKTKSVRRDFVLCLFFIFFWLFPIFYTGLTHKKISFLPRYITYFQSISNLFTNAVPVWPMPYIQIQLNNSQEWLTLKESDYFQAETFGYRTRLFEALYYGTNIIDYEKKTQRTREEMAQWIARRYEALYRPNQPVTAVRFVAGLYWLDPKKKPNGHWQLINLKSFRPQDIYVLSVHPIGKSNAQ